MPVWLIDTPMAIVLICMLIVALASAVTKWVILPLLGIDWPYRPVRAPFRFSLLSVAILVAMTAIVLGLLRDSREASLIGLVMVFVAWFTSVRYIAFRRSLSDRSQRALTSMINDEAKRVGAKAKESEKSM